MFYCAPWSSHPVKLTVWPTILFNCFCLHKAYMQLNSWGLAGKWDFCPDQQPAESTHRRTDRTVHQTHRSEPPFISLSEHRVRLGLCCQPAQATEQPTLTVSRCQQKNNLLKQNKRWHWPPASSTVSMFLLVIYLFYVCLLYINICISEWKRLKDFWMQWAGQSTE